MHYIANTLLHEYLVLPKTQLFQPPLLLAPPPLLSIPMFFIRITPVSNTPILFGSVASPNLAHLLLTR